MQNNLTKVEFDGEIAAIMPHGPIDTLSVGTFAAAARADDAIGLPQDFIAQYAGTTCIIAGRYDTPNKGTFDVIVQTLAAVPDVAVHQEVVAAHTPFTDAENLRYDRHVLYVIGDVVAGLQALAENADTTGLGPPTLQRAVELARKQGETTLATLLPTAYHADYLQPE